MLAASPSRREENTYKKKINKNMHAVKESLGDSSELEGNNQTLSDRLKGFKSSQFDVDAFIASKCQQMSEKEIKHLCSYLIELKKASAEEMRKSVYANYSAFIRTSREISFLEGELLSMRNLLSTQGALVHGLADGTRINSLLAGSDDSMEVKPDEDASRQLSKTANWFAEFLDNLEVLLAEKRVTETMAALDEGERVAREASDNKTMSPDSLLRLQKAITELRQKLAQEIVENTYQPFMQGSELRSAVVALKTLGDGPRAHKLLLDSYQQRLQRGMQNLRSSTASFGGAFTTFLSQLVFAIIAKAANDSLAIFREEPAYTSELVTWAVKQTEAFALLLKRHVLASSAASGGLRVATECIQISLGHCSLLEARGLALSPVLLRLLRPSVEQALTTNLTRIEQSSAALAAADDWVLSHPPLSSASSLSNAMASQPKLSGSAHRFNSMVQELLEDVGPLASLQLDGPALEGVLQLFNSYVSLLINALPGSAENEEDLEGSGSKIVRMAENEAQQLALLSNASLLADDFLPRAGLKLLLQNQPKNRADATQTRAPDRQTRLPEQREWKKKLQRSVDRLRDSFCRQHALELIFTEEGDIRLNAQIYLSVDETTEEPAWVPSAIFQELFAKLRLLASIATDMFVGRERFATILLMRLTETVILWLSDDQSFWEEIEQGAKPLGPLGLQQFYLDMEFVMIFASQGRYLSRNLQVVIKNIIARAIEAVSATGVDSYSTLPEDDWFVEVAEAAVEELTGKKKSGNLDETVSSPTGSQ